MSDHASAPAEATQPGPGSGADQLLAHRVLPERTREVIEAGRTLTGRLNAKPVATAVLVVGGIFVMATAGGLLGKGIASAISSIKEFDKEAGGLALTSSRRPA